MSTGTRIVVTYFSYIDIKEKNWKEYRSQYWYHWDRNMEVALLSLLKQSIKVSLLTGIPVNIQLSVMDKPCHGNTA